MYIRKLVLTNPLGVIIYAEPNVNVYVGNRQMRKESTVFLDVATHR